MAGIYIHIPFCKQACYYCNFHFSTSPKLKKAVIYSIIKEIRLRHERWNHFKYETIYFGGGTPSIISTNDIERILYELRLFFNITPDAEITLEANPDDLSSQKLKELKKIGINRLSIGIQTFSDLYLKFLNRSHSGRQAHNVIKRAYENGFENISVDLIYGMPEYSNELWIKNVQEVLKYQIPHISAYALTIEEKTVLNTYIKKGIVSKPSEKQVAEQFYIIRNLLQKEGYLHYEISNFGKPNYLSKHNKSYWEKIPYLGLGPGAHSYNGKQRRWNVANNHIYIKKIGKKTYYEWENLTPENHYNELIMTGLRTMWGVNLNDVYLLGHKYHSHLKKSIEKYIKQKILYIEDNHLKAYADKWFLIEGVISDLFIV
jgi:oxygen-independent coproporphyrinogen-3 oxidase